VKNKFAYIIQVSRMRENLTYGLTRGQRITMFTIIIFSLLLFNRNNVAQNAQLILAGRYKGYGDIYSPEIVGNKMLLRLTLFEQNFLTLFA